MPEEGFNVFGALDKATCAVGGADSPGNIYCLGSYNTDDALNANLANSYTGREWSNLAPFDAAHPGGSS